MPAQVITDGQDPLDPPGTTAPGRVPMGPPDADPWTYPTAMDTIGAAFRQYNPVISALDAITRSRPDMTPVPGYDPITKLKGTKDEDLIDQSLADVNPAQTDARIAKKDAEIKNQQILAASGWPGTIWSYAAGALDPLWGVPIVGELNVARGVGIAARVARGAAEGAIKSTLSEGALQASQVTRTGSESMGNVATNTLLMGLIGGGLGMLSAEERAATRTSFDKVRNDLSQPVRPDAVPAPELPLRGETVPDGEAQPRVLASDLSAAESDKRSMLLKPILLPDNIKNAVRGVPVLGKAYDYVSGVMMKFSPTLRTFSLDSDWLPVKRDVGDLVESSLKFTQAEGGVTTARGGVPVDRMVKMQQLMMESDTQQTMHDAFIDYRGLEAQKFARTKASWQDFRGDTNKMSWDDFNEAVHSAAIGGDVHQVPQVQKAAQEIRQKVFNPVTKLSQRVIGPDGKPMLGEALEPPKGDKSFFPRMWDKVKVAAGYNQLKGTITDWLEGEQKTKAAAKDRLQIYSDALRQHEYAIAKMEAKLQGADRAGGKAGEIDTLEQQLIDEHGKAETVRAKIEKELGDWEGTSSEEAKAALKLREETDKARQLKEAARLEAGEAPRIMHRLTGADTAVDRSVKHIIESDRDLSRQDLGERAQEIINRINSSPDGRLPYDVASGGPAVGPPGERQQVRGSLNSRDFAIPTSLVKDFVVTDVQHAVSSYLRTVLPDLHLTDRFGDVDMTQTFKKINETYDKRVTAATTPAEALKFERERDVVARDVAAMRDRVRNVYGWEMSKANPNMARIARTAMNWNLITDLGTSVFNRLNDATNAVWRHGLMNVFRDGYLPFFRSLVGFDKDFAAANKQAMRDMGIGVDTALHMHSYQLGDIIDNQKPGNKFERALDYSAKKAMMINLHAQWTDGVKSIGGTVAAADFLRTAEKFANGAQTADDIRRMAESGIEPRMAERIWAAYKDNGGEEFDGTHVPNTADWKDDQARLVFTAAIGKAGDQAVLTPGAERPLWGSQPVFALLGQYTSFVAAAHEKLLISNLQQRDIRTLQGLIASLGMGMLSYRAYTFWSGQAASDRPQDWIKEAVSRSAILGWLTEINNKEAKFFGGKTDAFNLIGADRPLSRRQTNSALSELLGPTYSRLEGIAGGLNDASHGTWTAMDTHKLRQAIWLQNLFAVRKLLDSAEDGFNEYVGVKPMNRNPAGWPSVPGIQMTP
jgi:hypothetical protein